MQRKNNFLKIYDNTRSAFAMIMAVGVLVIIATIMTLSLKMTTMTSKRTTDVYLHEQAVLLTRAATEYTLLATSANNRTAGGCLNTINAVYPDNTNPIFNININLRYIGLQTTAPSCNSWINTITTPQSIGNVLLDVTVTSVAGVSNEPIRYHRRTIQKL